MPRHAVDDEDDEAPQNPSAQNPSPQDLRKKIEADERLTYTCPEVAKLLGISRSFCYELVKRRILPAIHAGRRVLIGKSALLRWIDEGGQSEGPASA